MTHETDRLYHTWVSSDRRVPSRFVRPLLKFTHVEAAGGMVLLIATFAALVWANGPFAESYSTFWNTHLSIEIGPFHFDESLKHVVNDALMTVFFFVVGLEIKRELVVGELNDLKRAALPAIAALGGMVVPALIYVAFNAGAAGEASQGWGIPMATDIAFSIGIISLLGTRVSVSAKLFLLALAIADDIGAIAVIAIFYTSDLGVGWLAAALAGLGLVYAAQRAQIRSMLFYVLSGTAIWFLVFESGVHATLAGVTLGLLTPVRSYIPDGIFRQRSRWILDRYEMDAASTRPRERIDSDAMELSAIAKESVSPLDRLEAGLHPWSSFVIVPLFALANAGVRFSDINVGEALTSTVALGVTAGLVVGKIVGITVATFLAVRFGMGTLPRRTGWRQIVGLAALAGVGFTVSLFITELAFTSEEIADAAKLGIFAGSTIAGLLGYSLLRSSKTPQQEIDEARVSMGLDDYAFAEDTDGTGPQATPT